MFKKAKCHQTRKYKIIDYLLHIYNLTKLNQDEIKNLNRPTNLNGQNLSFKAP